jgi:uncharacterized protein YvpB
MLWVLPLVTLLVGAPAAPPPRALIREMRPVRQQHPLSCEYSGVRAALARWGIQVTEEDLIEAIPRHPDPHIGFRGDIDAAPGGTADYGIYPEPIVRFLETRAMRGKLLTGTVRDLQAEIARGRPVLVWVRAAPVGGPAKRIEVQGLPVLLVPYEHVVVAYGYDETGFHVVNPFTGLAEHRRYARFDREFRELGRMALSIAPASSVESGETPGIAPALYRYYAQARGRDWFGAPLGEATHADGAIVQEFQHARLRLTPPSRFQVERCGPPCPWW